MNTQYLFEEQMEDLQLLILVKLEDLIDEVRSNHQELVSTKEVVRNAGEVLARV